MTKRKITIWNYGLIEEYISKFGYSLVESGEINKNISAIKKFSFRDSDGYKYYMSINGIQKNIKRNSNFERFSKSNPFTIDNIKNWLSINDKNFELISKNFKSTGDILIFKCTKTNKKFKSTWNKISTPNSTHGNGCTPDPRLLSSKEILKRLSSIGVKQIDRYINAITPIKVECLNCGHRFKISISSISSRMSSCTKCTNSSKGERKIYNYLDKKNVEYIMQYRFDGCRNVLPLPFDFYLPNYNLCIEYQGEQHYNKDSWFSKNGKLKDSFLEVKKRDKIKKVFCSKNKINFLEIPYWEFNNIEKILKYELNL